MKVCIIGTGYVGLVSSLCLAELGHEVISVDLDDGRIDCLKKGEPPIYEKGLLELLKKNKVSFTTDLKEGLKGVHIVINAVGTPPDEQRKVNLKCVWQVAEDVAKLLDHYIIFVNKSTVPVGTAQEVKRIIQENTNIDFDVASNPEFLREGSAIEDFLNPDRIVVGVDSVKAEKVMKELYEPLKTRLMITDIKSAELIKYASNSFLATKISFINEIALLAEKVGADVSEVAKGMGLDKRIGDKFLKPGPGYGGSCFPKDVDGLIHLAIDNNINLRILESVRDANEFFQAIAILKLKKHTSNVSGKTIAIWGLAFKANTDDVRESSALKVIEKLVQEGAKVKCYDPIALFNAKKALNNGIEFCNSKEETLSGSEALIIMTDWEEFKEADLKEIKKHLNVIIDTRNIFERKEIEELGMKYEGIGKLKK